MSYPTGMNVFLALLLGPTPLLNPLAALNLTRHPRRARVFLALAGVAAWLQVIAAIVIAVLLTFIGGFFLFFLVVPFAWLVFAWTRAARRVGPAGSSGGSRWMRRFLRASAIDLATFSGLLAVLVLVLVVSLVWDSMQWKGPFAESERELLEWAGLVSDDIASQVLVLNVPVTDGVVGEWMRSARGIPFRLTLQQLRRESFAVDAPVVSIVENPSILRAAADAMGPDCPPLVCTEGVPSAAVYRLLGAATRAQLRWRGDFDWAGLRIVKRGLERFANAEPWRMSAEEYRSGAKGIALRGSRVETPWDHRLSEFMAAEGRAVMEESLIGLLLQDLRKG